MTAANIWHCEGNFATAGTELVLTVWRIFPYGAETIDYAITAGTAVEDTDYDASLDALSGTLSFADEEVFKAIRINTMTGGASGNRTVTLTISNQSAGSLGDTTAIGTIQDGDVYYFAASAAGSGDGSSAANAAAFSRTAFQTQIAAAGAGDAFVFKRGDTFLWDAIQVIEADEGGTPANPVMISAYGTGAKPIWKPNYDGGLIRWQDADIKASSKAMIVQDINPVPSTYVATHRVAFGFIDQASRASDNITLQHLEWEYVSGNDNWNYLASIAGGSGHKFQFNLVDGCYENAIFGGTPAQSTTVKANRILNGGNDATRDWGIYCTSNTTFTCLGNFLKNTIQGIKMRGGEGGIVCSYNHIEPRSNGTTIPRVGITYGGGADSKVIDGLVVENNVIIGASTLIGEQSNSSSPATTIVSSNMIHRNNFHWIDSTYYSPTSALLVVTHAQQIGGLDIYHNTFVVDGKDYGCMDFDNGTQVYGAGSNVRVKNNLCVRTATSGAANPLVDIDGTFITHCEIDHTHYYDEDAANLVRVDGVNYTTVAAFNAAHGHEDNGASGLVNLVGDSFPVDLIPTGVSAGEASLVTDDLIGTLARDTFTRGCVDVPTSPVRMGT